VVTARFVTREVHVVASVDVLGADAKTPRDCPRVFTHTYPGTVPKLSLPSTTARRLPTAKAQWSPHGLIPQDGSLTRL